MRPANEFSFPFFFLFCAYGNLDSLLVCGNSESLSTRKFAIIMVTDSYSIPSNQDSPPVGLVCCARPFAEVITVFAMQPYFNLASEFYVNILVMLRLRIHIEYSTHYFVKSVAL